MKGLIFGVFAIMMLTPAQGEEEEQLKQLMESVGFEEDEKLLECFRCDLGFWDTCYTTETKCSVGERCYTGRGKAADTLDVKTLGCVKAYECDLETTVELFSNNTIFVMTKYCCDTSFCNSAHKLPTATLLYLTVAVLTTWYLSEASTGSQ
ncbi:sperm acrosome membrane-associated protein 4-like [Anarrhichthys ocellatus]|uniref:sperm acrosome membrane-associated protein 4-like n=1 Tax=Anarrhichthys ocellatus TaxID=433405 RepID=UPI0012EE48AC|nr:sperm acrosome membrane-associated protein 4-like [Anarrhichthys ocellatus]